MKSYLLRHRSTLLKSILALSALVMVSCASAPIPVEKLAVAAAAVERANTASTRESAPAELQTAIGKLASAREAVDRRDYERAEQLAEQAILDAQLAELHAQAVRAGVAARETQEAARILRNELNR
jgi:biopolymer transport protein ExbB/TolQ